jgi:preprotein translocase subunit SecG
MLKVTLFCTLAVVLVLTGMILLSCGSGSSGSMTSKSATVNLTVSDPADLFEPAGPVQPRVRYHHRCSD